VATVPGDPPGADAGRTGVPRTLSHPPEHEVGWGQALRIATNRESLKRTVLAATVVGTTLVFVNLADLLTASSLAGWLGFKVFLTYAVPWGNATMGIALGVRGTAGHGGVRHPRDHQERRWRHVVSGCGRGKDG
jgi:hypothetical protein